MNTISLESDECERWRFAPYALAFVAGVLIFMTIVPSLDGANEPRLTFLVCISILYWLRFAVARYQHDRSQTYRFYYLVIILSGPIELIAEAFFVG